MTTIQISESILGPFARPEDARRFVAILAEEGWPAVYREPAAGEMANEAKEVQLRAERKAGAFLRGIERAPAGNARVSPTFQPETQVSDYAEALEATGISRPTAHRWQKISEVPDEEFEGYIQEKREKGDELTQADYRRFMRSFEAALDKCWPNKGEMHVAWACDCDVLQEEPCPHGAENGGTDQ